MDCLSRLSLYTLYCALSLYADTKLESQRRSQGPLSTHVLSPKVHQKTHSRDSLCRCSLQTQSLQTPSLQRLSQYTLSIDIDLHMFFIYSIFLAKLISQTLCFETFYGVSLWTFSRSLCIVCLRNSLYIDSLCIETPCIYRDSLSLYGLLLQTLSIDSLLRTLSIDSLYRLSIDSLHRLSKLESQRLLSRASMHFLYSFSKQTFFRDHLQRDALSIEIHSIVFLRRDSPKTLQRPSPQTSFIEPLSVETLRIQTLYRESLYGLFLWTLS